MLYDVVCYVTMFYVGGRFFVWFGKQQERRQVSSLCWAAAGRDCEEVQAGSSSIKRELLLLRFVVAGISRCHCPVGISILNIIPDTTTDINAHNNRRTTSTSTRTLNR